MTIIELHIAFFLKDDQTINPSDFLPKLQDLDFLKNITPFSLPINDAPRDFPSVLFNSDFISLSFSKSRLDFTKKYKYEDAQDNKSRLNDFKELVNGLGGALSVIVGYKSFGFVRNFFVDPSKLNREVDKFLLGKEFMENWPPTIDAAEPIKNSNRFTIYYEYKISNRDFGIINDFMRIDREYIQNENTDSVRVSLDSKIDEQNQKIYSKEELMCFYDYVNSLSVNKEESLKKIICQAPSVE